MIEIKRVVLTVFCIICLTTISISASDNAEFIPYINACSAIREYDGNAENVHTLAVDVMNSHHKFREVSLLTPNSTATGNLKMCDAKFIDDIMYKTFRITTPRPAPDRLMDLGYYYNNGYYYYKDNGLSHSVKINEIINTISMDDGGVYVIFTNTVTSDNSSPLTETSAVEFHRDDSGLFVSAIHMGLDFSNLSEHLKTPEPAMPYIDYIRDMLPVLVLVITLAVAIVILCKFVLF